MDISKLFSIVTPLMIVAFMGVIAIAQGFVHMKQENNILQFMFGIPIAIGMAGLHFGIRKAARNNTLHVWIIESILVTLMWFGFHHS